MRDSCIFYRSFFEAIKELPKENQADIYNAIFEHSLNFKEVELSGVSKTIMTLIKPQLDANIKRFNNGKQPKTNQEESKPEAKQKQNKSKTKANNNNNVNPNVNGNDNQNENNNVNIYRKFDHLILSQEDFEKLCLVYKKEQIDSTLDSIENYSANKKYKNLYLTANNWLKKEFPNQTAPNVVQLEKPREGIIRLGEGDNKMAF